MKNKIKDTRHRLKGLFHKRKEEIDMALFHCSDCGNDFEAQRHIAREDFDDENLSITIVYFPAKCPKCGNWATTPKTIQQYKVS